MERKQSFEITFPEDLLVMPDVDDFSKAMAFLTATEKYPHIVFENMSELFANDAPHISKAFDVFADVAKTNKPLVNTLMSKGYLFSEVGTSFHDDPSYYEKLAAHFSSQGLHDVAKGFKHLANAVKEGEHEKASEILSKHNENDFLKDLYSDIVKERQRMGHLTTITQTTKIPSHVALHALAGGAAGSLVGGSLAALLSRKLNRR